MQLTTTEEQLMHHLWKLENAFLKDLIELYPDPKPATTTVATLLKRMTDKQFVGYNVQGNTRIYFPLVSKNEYFSKYMNGLIKNFFDNSASQFASFFTTATNLTEKELKDLRSLVENELKKKKHE